MHQDADCMTMKSTFVQGRHVSGHVVICNSTSSIASNALSKTSTVTETTNVDETTINRSSHPKSIAVQARLEAFKQLCKTIEHATSETMNKEKSSHAKLVKEMIKQIIAMAIEKTQHCGKDKAR